MSLPKGGGGVVVETNVLHPKYVCFQRGLCYIDNPGYCHQLREQKKYIRTLR